MKPPVFDYLRAESMQRVLEALAHAGEDARVFARGQSLMAVLNMRFAQPQLLVSILRTYGLNAVRVEDGYLEVSAAATQGNAERHPPFANEVSLLALAFPHILHFQIRNHDAVRGSIAHADPSVELPLVLIALDGQVVLRSLCRRRVMQATDFPRGMLMTVCEPDELVEAVRFPLRQPGVRYSLTELSAHYGNFALVACAAIVTDDAIVLAVGGVVDRPVLGRQPCLQGKTLMEAINDFS